MSRRGTLAIAALITAVILGGVFTLGRSLATGKGQRTLSGATSPAAPTAPSGPVDSGPVAPGAESPSAVPGAESPSAVPGAGPDRDRGEPPLPFEANGPYGARITTGSPEVALTFDDGPDPRYTPTALTILRDYGIRATFCVVGTNAAAYPELVRAIVSEGHTLCNHSWTHDVLLGSRPQGEILADLSRTNEAIRAAVPDARIAYFRQPGGAWTPSVVAVAGMLGMTSLHWTVDPQDWTLPGAGNIAAMVNAAAFPGAIVLLHDAGGDRQGTMSALNSMLPDLSRRFEIGALPVDVPAAEAPRSPPWNPSPPSQPGPL